MEIGKKIILITGASGYTGQKLVDYYSSKDFKVISLVRNSSAAEIIAGLQNISQVEYFDGSLNSVVDVFKKYPIFSVIHTASIAKYDHSSAEIDDFIQANLVFGTYILQAMAETGCKNLINFSTYWQNYQGEVYKPICFYASLKQAFENIIDYYAFDKNISAISLRIFDIYGPADNRPKIFTLLQNNKKGEKLKMSAGDQKINLIYIDDVISATEIALGLAEKSSATHKVYFTYGNQTLTLKEIVKNYNQITNNNVEIEWGALPYRKNQIMEPYLGTPLPGFKAKHDLKDTLNKL